MGREKRNISLRKKYAIVGDGRTEQFYFDHLKKINGYNYSVKPSLFDNISFEEAEEIICNLLEGGTDLVVFFTDYDTIVKEQKKDKFDCFCRNFEKNEKVLICESMPSIEFWFLIHYQYTTRPFRNCAEVEQALKKFIPNYCKNQSRFLQNKNWVEELCENGKFEKAMANARKLLKQKDTEDIGDYFPFTKIHLGIDKFEGIKKK
ncbi:MAG: RloB domain-containing protein [Bacilli bacterium]|nr:RloB domain-containing protein [Bacilli bacterium]